MTTVNFTIGTTYTEVANGASLITLNQGNFVRLHIKAAGGNPAINVPFHPFDHVDGERSFPYGGTERVFARKETHDKNVVILAVTLAA